MSSRNSPKYRSGPKGGAKQRRKRANKERKLWRIAQSEATRREKQRDEEWKAQTVTPTGDAALELLWDIFDPPDPVIRQGLALLRQERFSEAAAWFGNRLLEAPMQAEYYYYRARAFERAGQFEEALADLELAIRLGGPDYRYHRSRADCFAATGRLAEAVIECGEAIRLALWKMPHYQRRASWLFTLGRYDEAVQDWAEVICVLPPDRHAQPLFLQAAALERSGRYAEASRNCTAVLGLEPNNLRALSLRAWCFFAGSQWHQAVNDYSSLLEQGQTAERFWYRGQCHQCMGGLVAAVADYTQAIRLNNDDWRPHFSRASAYLELGRLSDAHADFAAWVRLDPGCAEAWLALASCLGTLTRWDEALTALNRAIELAPADRQSRVARAQVLRALDREEEAKKDEEIARDLN